MIAAVSAILALALVPQGGQGGAGAGGLGGGFGGGGLGGGGFGGGRGGQVGIEPGEEQTFNHILTPGDKTEWPFKVKAGEVLILKASSDSFDPAIEVVDSAGKKIAENDDVEDGQQNALVLVHFEKEGEYKAHVKNYRSTSGGRYEFKVRRFITKTLTAGEPLKATSPDGVVFLRVMAPKGSLVTLTNEEGNSFTGLTGPDGKPHAWLPTYGGAIAGTFPVDSDGGYYVTTRVKPPTDTAQAGRADPETTLTANVAETRPVQQGGQQSVEVKNPSIDVWTFTAKAGDFIKFTAASETGPMDLYIQRMPIIPGESKPAFGFVAGDSKRQMHRNIAFFKDGVYKLYVDPGTESTAYSFSALQAWKPWDGVSDLGGDLVIGETVFYGFDAKPGHMVRLAGEAKTFDLFYSIYNADMDSTLAADDVSFMNLNPQGTVSLPAGGRHYLAVSCFGGGGGGPYRFDATEMRPSALAIGESREASLNTPLEGLWTVKLDSGKTYGLRVRSKAGAPTILYSPGGKMVAVRSVMINADDWLFVFDAGQSGEYRIWRQFRGEKHNYTFELTPLTK